MPIIAVVVMACIFVAISCNDNRQEAIPVTPPCIGHDGEASQCSERDVSTFQLFAGPSEGAAYNATVEVASVEDVLEKGLRLSEASPVHIAIRGTAQADSVRCEWRGVARTPTQREEAIRFWLSIDDATPLPSPATVEAEFMSDINRMAPRFRDTMEANFKALARGGLSTETMFLNCYARFTIHEYLHGSGTNPLDVAYNGMGEARSYDLYRRSHEDGRFGNEALKTRDQYEAALNRTKQDTALSLSGVIGGRESVIFLAPMGAHNAIAVEAWQVVEQWDLQIDDASVVNAVRYGAPPGDPEHTQTLANLRSRITTAAASDAFAGSRIANTSGLRQYYIDIGAYGDITPGDGSTATFTPAQPPGLGPTGPSSPTESQ